MTDIAHPIPQIKPNLRASLASVWKARKLSQRSWDVLVQTAQLFAATLFIYSLYAAALLYVLPLYLPGFPAPLLVGGIVFMAFVYIVTFGIALCHSFDTSSLSFHLDLISLDVKRLEQNLSAGSIEKFIQTGEELEERLHSIERACPFSKD